MTYLQVLIFGISLGGVYALMASGLTLIFGVMNIVNLAHAAFMLISAYMALGLFNAFGIDPILSVVITMPVLFFFGMLVYKLLFSRIAESSRFVESTVLLTFAMATVIEGVLSFLFTGIYRSTTPAYTTETLHVGALYFPEGQFYATVVSVILLVALWTFLRTTRTGYAIRATMQNRTAAKTVGVDVAKISLITFGIGTALAGASGSLISFIFTFYPAIHWDWIAIMMALIVLGGMGSLLGSLVGSFLLAIVAGFVGHFIGPVWSTITFFLALFVILLVRPQGLFGKKVEV
ncbi:MAG: branched-chain amino acid ABC transporter permease [Spirochaetes bacterium]|jgi:branched-chain amino acid transport system permease protein|nr:branched-chain amino acid ABC transporter permease [Spirochaetota bacterium]